MEKKEENKNLQGRREFFKNAAKKVLPMLGMVALLSNPVIAKAVETASTDCYLGGCTSGCRFTCRGCEGECTSCTGTCKDYCKDDCTGGCTGTCNRSCYGGCNSECTTLGKY